MEGRGEAEVESEDDPHEIVPESECQREEELEAGHHREHSDSEEKEEYSQRIVSSRRTAAVQSESDRYDKNAYVDQDGEEVNQAGRYCCISISLSP